MYECHPTDRKAQTPHEKNIENFSTTFPWIKKNPKGKRIFLFKEWSSKINMEGHFNYHVEGTTKDNNKAQTPSIFQCDKIT